MPQIIQYFVEGECEKALINELKQSPGNTLLAGKVEVFNFINKILSDQRILALRKNTIIVLVYDIDVEKTDILEANISKLRNFGFNNVKHIQSIKNFEEELVYSSSLKNINAMYNTEGLEEFKNKFLHQSNLYSKLRTIDFDINKMWSRVNYKSPFNTYSKKEDLVFVKAKKK